MMEKWPEDRDIQQWRQGYRILQDGGGASCPDHDRLIALVLHETQDAERDQLADHLVRCRRCTDCYRTLLRLYHDLTGILPSTGQPGSVTTDGTGEGAEPR
jgi:hypothetical protein